MGDSAPDDGVVRDAAWMDAERKRVIAREYLTHIGEAKQYVCAQTQREIELERERGAHALVRVLARMCTQRE
jgi:hypothetical protein